MISSSALIPRALLQSRHGKGCTRQLRLESMSREDFTLHDMDRIATTVDLPGQQRQADPSAGSVVYK